MGCTESSAQSSSFRPSDLDGLDNELIDQLTSRMDSLLDQYGDNQSESWICEKSTDWLPSASNGAKILEGVLENLGIFVYQISEDCGKDHSTAISVLKAAGNVHWAGLPLLLVAAVLNRLDTIKKNKMKCTDLLKSMKELAKVVRKLKDIPRAKDEMRNQIDDSIALVVQGAILCCSQKKTRWVKRFFNASKDRDAFVAIRSKVDEMYTRLNINMGAQNLWMSAQSLSILEKTLGSNQPHVPSINVQLCNQPHIPSVNIQLESK